MPWDFGAGVAGAAESVAKNADKQIDREGALQQATNLEAMKTKVENDKRAAIAKIAAGVSRTKDVPIAGPNPDGTPLMGTSQQAKTESEYRRDVGDAFTKAGLIDHAEKAYTAADRHEENMFNRTTQAAKQRADEERWHAQFAQQAAYNKASLANQGAQLALKGQEKKEFDAAADAYSTYKAQYDVLVAQKADPDSIRSIKSAMDRAALSLKQFKVDVSEAGPGAKLGQLNTMLTAVNSTIEKKRTDGKDTTADEATRESIREAMDAELKGRGAGGGDKSVLPPVDAISDLLAGKGNDTSFDKHFGKGSAAAARAAAKDTKPAGKVEPPPTTDASSIGISTPRSSERLLQIEELLNPQPRRVNGKLMTPSGIDDPYRRRMLENERDELKKSLN